MDGGERAPESRVVAVSAQLKVLEHEECLLARLTLAQRDGNSGAGRGKRGEAVGFGSEKRMSAVRREALPMGLPSLRDHGAGSAFSNLRARPIAARTCTGAVPPTCERLAMEPSRVSTR